MLRQLIAPENRHDAYAFAQWLRRCRSFENILISTAIVARYGWPRDRAEAQRQLRAVRMEHLLNHPAAKNQ